MTAPWCQWQGADLVLIVRLQPRAAKNEWIGPHGGAIKIRLTAPPVDGKANQALIEFIADLFGVAKSQVELLSGTTGRDKRVRISSPKKTPTEIPLQQSR